MAVEWEPVLLGAGLCKDEQGAMAFWLHPMYLAVRVVNCPTVLYYVKTSRLHGGLIIYPLTVYCSGHQVTVLLGLDPRYSQLWNEPKKATPIMS